VPLLQVIAFRPITFVKARKTAVRADFYPESASLSFLGTDFVGSSVHAKFAAQRSSPRMGFRSARTLVEVFVTTCTADVHASYPSNSIRMARDPTR
jgi:hypothetical protein